MGEKTFEIVFDFIEHNLLIQKNDGTAETLRLAPSRWPEFYAEVMAALRSMGIAVKIWTMPSRFPNPIPFDRTAPTLRMIPTTPIASGASSLRRMRSSRNSAGGSSAKRAGSFLLGQFRLGGDALFRPPRAGNSRRRSDHAGGFIRTGEQRGWWPGDAMVKVPAFFSYAAPQPSGFSKAPVRPAAASYNIDLLAVPAEV